jgi:hypothetical protein
VARHRTSFLLLTLLAGGSTNCLLDTGPINMPPTVQIAEHNQPLHRGDPVTFTANVHDPDQSTASLNIAWYVARDGNCEHATASTPACRAAKPNNDQCCYTPEDLGPVCVVVRVTDRYGAIATASRTFDVTDRPPVAVIERTSPVSTDATLPLFSELTFSAAKSSDPDPNDALTYEWTITQPDGSGLWDTNCHLEDTPTICSFTASMPGKYHVQVKTTDPYQMDNSASLDVMIAQDQPPKAVIERTSPVSTTTPLPLFSTLIFSAAQSTDPDMVNGDSLTFAWTITKPDGTSLSATNCPSAQTPDVCTFTAANPGTYHVQVVATDSSQAHSAPASLDVAIAQDQPPCIVGFSPTTLSTIGFANQSLTFQVSNVSDDGDPYTGSGPTTGTFIWSYRTSTTGAFMRTQNLYNSNRMDFGAGAFVIGDVLQIRVEYQDRVNRNLSSCAPNVDRCELVTGCAQWVTWTVYFL